MLSMGSPGIICSRANTITVTPKSVRNARPIRFKITRTILTPLVYCGLRPGFTGRRPESFAGNDSAYETGFSYSTVTVVKSTYQVWDWAKFCTLGARTRRFRSLQTITQGSSSVKIFSASMNCWVDSASSVAA